MIKTSSQFASQMFGKLSALAAVLAVGLALTFSGSAAAQSSTPNSIADCNRWRSYSQDFGSKADCVEFVQANAGNNNGYGGGGGGNGGGIGDLIRRVVNFISSIVQWLVGFIGRLF